MSFFSRLPLFFLKSFLVKSTQLIDIYLKTTFSVTYATSFLKRYFSLSKNDQEEAAKSVGDTKASYDPNKCDAKTGLTGPWIYHRMVE